MAKVICNTSPLQYLHQIGLLGVLRDLSGNVVVPPAVVAELEDGRRLGVDLPRINDEDWVSLETPRSVAALPLVTDLGKGEAEVLMLALESEDAVVVLDDSAARATAKALRIPMKGTLGILLEAKRRGAIAAVCPYLDRLDDLGFRLSRGTRLDVLALAGERAAG